MIVLIESKLSGLYFGGFGCWVTDLRRAMEFGDIESARAFVQREHLDDVRVVPLAAAPDEVLISAA